METAEHICRCLNCGRRFSDGNYCPWCGQHRDTGRLTTKNFMITVFAGLTRINMGFLYTCLSLLIHPWQVIRDYLNGKRVRYTGPVQTLIVLCFISLVVEPWFGEPVASVNAGELPISQGNYIGRLVVNVLEWFMASPTVQNLTVFIPAVPAFMWVTSHGGRMRYNFAECLLGAIYTSAAMFLFSLVMLPLRLVAPLDSSWASLIYIVAVGSTGVYKALGYMKPTLLQRVARIAAFYLLSILNYLILIAVVVYCIYFFVVVR